MTREEAIEILLDMANELQLIPESKQGQAFKVAIKALEQEPCEDKLYDIFSRIIDDMYNELSSVKPQEQKTDSWSIKDVADTLAKHGLIKEQNPKTGHWIKLFLIDTSDIDGQCSECGFIHRFIDGHTTQYDYCPNCGAKMEGEDKAAFKAFTGKELGGTVHRDMFDLEEIKEIADYLMVYYEAHQNGD